MVELFWTWRATWRGVSSWTTFNCGFERLKANFPSPLNNIRAESRETTANHVPDVPQKIRARFKAQNPGSGMPPFIRVETENTSPEYRLEARRRASDTGEEALTRSGSFDGPSVPRIEAPLDRRGPPPPHRRSLDGRGRSGRRGGRFNDRPPRGSPRGPRPDRRDFRRASSSSFDSPREGPTSPRFSSSSFEAQPHDAPGTPTESDRDRDSQIKTESQPSPDGAGQKRGYTDAFAPSNNNASRGYNLDDSSAPATSRQRLD